MPLQPFLPTPASQHTLRPLLGSVRAGFPSPAGDAMETRLDLNALVIQHEEATFYLRVQGRSMERAGLFEGDVLVVDRAIEPTNGKVVIAIVDGEYTVKRLRCDHGHTGASAGKVWLQAEGDGFADIELTDGQHLEICGVVTHAVRRL